MATDGVTEISGEAVAVEKSLQTLIENSLEAPAISALAERQTQGRREVADRVVVAEGFSGIGAQIASAGMTERINVEDSNDGLVVDAFNELINFEKLLAEFSVVRGQ